MNKNIKISYLIGLLFTVISSCVTDDHIGVYKVSGVLHDGTNPKNKFSNVKLTFEDNTYFRNLITLGETFTDSNGYFEFYYETKEFKGDNFLRIFIDTVVIASNKLHGLPLAQNWHKDFYLGDSAILKLIINKNLLVNDTLLFTNGDSVYYFPGPINIGEVFIIKLRNDESIRSVCYCVGENNFSRNLIYTHCDLTGEPIVDKLTLF